MNELVKIFEQDPRATALLNFIACLVGVCWTLGLGAIKPEFKLGRRGWIVFWIATGAFYLLRTVFMDSWFPQLGLYVATAALLATLDPERTGNHLPRCRWIVIALASVIACLVADVIVAHASQPLCTQAELMASACKRPGEELGAHQLLTAIAIALWAWQARKHDLNASMILIVYALVQLPVHQILTVTGNTVDPSYPVFVQKTYMLYATLKLVLVPAVCMMLIDKNRNRATKAGESNAEEPAAE